MAWWIQQQQPWKYSKTSSGLLSNKLWTLPFSTRNFAVWWERRKKSHDVIPYHLLYRKYSSRPPFFRWPRISPFDWPSRNEEFHIPPWVRPSEIHFAWNRHRSLVRHSVLGVFQRRVAKMSKMLRERMGELVKKSCCVTWKSLLPSFTATSAAVLKVDELEIKFFHVLIMWSTRDVTQTNQKQITRKLDSSFSWKCLSLEAKRCHPGKTKRFWQICVPALLSHLISLFLFL